MVAQIAIFVNLMNQLTICSLSVQWLRLYGPVLLDVLVLGTYLVISINVGLGLTNGCLKVESFMS
jgi:hypothetical protein